MRQYRDPSDEEMAPIPDEPGQDPNAAEPGPYSDGYGLSDTPDSGYVIDRSPAASRLPGESGDSVVRGGTEDLQDGSWT